MGDATILIADDDPRTAKMLVLTLRASGFDNEVIVARDGVEALDYLLGADSEVGWDSDFVMPRFVLLDLSMPRMGGLGVLSRLRRDERTKLLPVVVFSNSSSPKDVADAYRLGATSYVDKLSEIPWPDLVPRIASYWLELKNPSH